MTRTVAVPCAHHVNTPVSVIISSGAAVQLVNLVADAEEHFKNSG